MPLTAKEKEFVVDGFEAAASKMHGLETANSEMKRNIDELHTELRTARRTMLTGKTPEGRQSNRFWQSDEQARAFGELILKAIGRKDLGESTQAGGGVLVPDELAFRIIELLGRYSKFRSKATVVTMGSGHEVVPKIESDLVVYCPGEGQSIPPSEPAFSQVGLTPKTWAALTKVSNELSDDSVMAIGEILAISLTRSMAKKEDEVGFVGDGSSTYFKMVGICQALLNVDATIGSIAGLQVGTGDTWPELTLADHQKVAGLLPSQFDDAAEWYMSKKYYFEVVYPLAMTAGVANIFEILSDRPIRGFLGYPVNFVHAMPTATAISQICCLLADLQVGAYLAQRKSLTIEKSTDVYFANNQIGVRGVQRIDVNAFGVGDTSEPGPIVGLITAAS